MHVAGFSKGRERGSVFLVVAVFLATAIAGLAAISAGRVVYASREQRTLEQGTRALNAAYAQIHLAMNVVNNSAYDADNQNLVLRDAIAGFNGGSVAKAGETPAVKKVANVDTGYVVNDGTVLNEGETGRFLDHKDDPPYGLIPATNVRVYRARDYIKRLQRLKGEPIEDIDPDGLSDSYFALEAAGRMGDSVRLVSALVRENEPFSSFVFFQNRATLGISGAPRGLIHANEQIAFYFPGGNYVDAVSAGAGFEYFAGATIANTGLRNANPDAALINLEKVDFVELKGKASLFVGQEGMDARIKLYSNGNVRIREYTPPRYEMVTKSSTTRQKVGSHVETYTTNEKVQVGTEQVPYQDNVFDYYIYETFYETQNVKTGETIETYYVTENVQTGVTTQTYYVTEKVASGTKKTKKTKSEPIYSTRAVTKYKQVKVWVPYNSGAGGGTSVGGGKKAGASELGEYVYVNEPYQTTEKYISGYKTVEYFVTETVYTTKQVKKTKKVKVYTKKKVKKTKKVNTYKTVQIKKTKEIPVYKTVTKYVTKPIYEVQAVTKQRTVNDYVDVTKTWQEKVFQWPVYQGQNYVTVNEVGGTLYIDGRVTGLYGNLKGRLTIVANEKVRVVGNIRYVDKNGNTAMSNGSDYTKPYERNPKYKGNSVLGVIARDDVIFTRRMPKSAEINGTLMSVNGRVGIDAFWADSAGELVRDSSANRAAYLTKEQQETEKAYDRSSYTRTRIFTKDSLRRMGGIISNNRIMETYITTKSDGTSRVSAGFKRGVMKFDINMMFNPPPDFVEVPRPVVTTFLPVLVTRDDG